MDKMFTFHQQAPDLRHKHLSHCLSHAHFDKDEHEARQVLILYQCENWKHQKRIKSIVKDPALNQFITVQVTNNTCEESLVKKIGQAANEDFNDHLNFANLA